MTLGQTKVQAGDGDVGVEVSVAMEKRIWGKENVAHRMKQSWAGRVGVWREQAQKAGVEVLVQSSGRKWEMDTASQHGAQVLAAFNMKKEKTYSEQAHEKYHTWL